MKNETPTSNGGDAGAASAGDPFSTMAQTYARLLNAMGGALGGGLQGMLSAGNVANPLLQAGVGGMLNPGAWLGGGMGEIDRRLDHLLRRPQLADIVETDREALKALSTWAELQQVGAEHQLQAWAVWSQAFQRFLVRLAELGAEGKAPTGLQELASLWTDTANRTMIESQRSERFLEGQRRLLRASLRYRAQEREVAERFCETHHIPTRGEVDEIHRAIHDIKRELRALRRTVSAMAAEPSGSGPSAGGGKARRGAARPEKGAEGARAGNEPGAAAGRG